MLHRQIGKRAVSTSNANAASSSTELARHVDADEAASVQRTLIRNSGSRSGLSHTLMALQSVGLLEESALTRRGNQRAGSNYSP